MSLSKSLSQVAGNILKKFGVEATFTNYAETGFNEGLGEPTFTETTFTAHGVKSTYSKTEIDGTTILSSDIKFIMENPDTVPLVGDKCAINGAGSYRVMNVTPTAPSEEDIIYEVQLRA